MAAGPQWLPTRTARPDATMTRAPIAVVLMLTLVSPAWAEALPADSGILDVRGFGARGDGVHDDTAAIQAAITASGGDTGSSFWHDRIVYLPDGTYLISGTLSKRYANGGYASGLALMGQSRDHTILKLRDHAVGFDDAAHPRAVIYTTSKHLDGSPTGGGKDYVGLGEGNDAYMNFVESLTIDVGAGDPGAIAIDYLANNIGAIRDVRLHAARGSGFVGVSMTRKWPGPALLQHLTIEGFATGIDVAQSEYGLTLEHVAVQEPASIGLRNRGNALAVRDLRVSASVPLVNAIAGGLVAIDGGNLAGLPPVNLGTMLLRDVSVGGATRDGIDAAGGWQASRRPPWAVIPVDAPAPFIAASSQWANVLRFGAVADGVTDATMAFRRAFASGAPIIYLPNGIYAISDRLDIPASVRRIAGMGSTLRILDRRQPAFSRTGGMMRIGTDGPPLSIERLAFDNTDKGAQLAIEMEGARDVVLRDLISAGVSLVNRLPPGGRLFVEDVCCGRIHIAGSASVFARQLDTEGDGVRILNEGAPLWVLGLKTEGICTVLDNQAGAQSEIFGGLVYMVRQSDPSVAALHNDRSWLAASFAEEVLLAGHGYAAFLRHGSTTLPVNAFPPRGLGHIVPDLRAAP